MREAEISVTFRPSGKTVYVLKGTRLLEAAAGADLVLDLPCGGEGICGKCRVVVSGGACEPTPAERRAFSDEQLRRGFRLACQSSVCGPMTVEVPQTSLLPARHKILEQTAQTSPVPVDPPIRKQYVELTTPRRGDDQADLTRLEQAVGPFDADLESVRYLPGQLRRAGFRGTAVLAEERILDFEPQNTEAVNLAVAVDVGTTTLAAALLDANTGRELGVTSRLNPQTRFGDDVLSRILFARQEEHALGLLHATIVTAVNEMIRELADRTGIDRLRIYQITLSGNTTMQQLLCRVDPSSLGEVPFVPAVGRGLALQASELGLEIHPRALVRVMPVIGGFVGGDTVSGILATGLAENEGPTLLVDIGTNGEIVLSADGKLSAASTAAGPAFEGARISHGMRGANGAIEKIVVDGRLRINVIGDVPPVGLCGSGLIDVAAELLRHGLLSPEGRLQTPERLSSDVLPDLAQRLIVHDGHPAFLLASAAETGNARPVLLTQRDLRELQLATGAIRAGVEILLRRAGVDPADLKAVLIAGGFGNFIRRNNAQRIGLIPPRVAHRHIRYQGNTSLAGARLVALSRKAFVAAEELARRTEHVDLSCDPEFQTAFSEAMIFPSDVD
ncbi:MAG: DUF4445 domain-containing protein [Pirellulales bacterium]|nr:DUF4445 domain-containing protein [Pirellulales bacterium]